MIPTLKPMRTPSFSQYVDPWPQIQVICIVEDQREAKSFHLLWCQTLDGCLCSNGHESRKERHAVWTNNLSRAESLAPFNSRGSFILETRARVVLQVASTSNCISS